MILAGKSHKKVAQILGVSERSIRRWYRVHKSGGTLETKRRSGRPPKFQRAAKIAIAKSLTKRRQSTRKLARRITNMGYPITHTTVRRYLCKSLGAKSYKRPKIPKLTIRQKENRLRFAIIVKIGQLVIGKEFCGLTNLHSSFFQLLIAKMTAFGRVDPRTVPPCLQVNFLLKSMSGG